MGKCLYCLSTDSFNSPLPSSTISFNSSLIISRESLSFPSSLNLSPPAQGCFPAANHWKLSLNSTKEFTILQNSKCRGRAEVAQGREAGAWFPQDLQPCFRLCSSVLSGPHLCWQDGHQQRLGQHALCSHSAREQGNLSSSHRMKERSLSPTGPM